MVDNDNYNVHIKTTNDIQNTSNIKTRATISGKRHETLSATPWKRHDWVQDQRRQDLQDHLQQHLDNDTFQVEDTVVHVHTPNKLHTGMDNPGQEHTHQEGGQTLDKWQAVQMLDSGDTLEEAVQAPDLRDMQ